VAGEAVERHGVVPPRLAGRRPVSYMAFIQVCRRPRFATRAGSRRRGVAVAVQVYNRQYAARRAQAVWREVEVSTRVLWAREVRAGVAR